MNYTTQFSVPDNQFQLKSGRYFVTDPCYLFQDSDKFGYDLWNSVCHAFFPYKDTPENKAIVMKFNGSDVYMFATAYGDGVFPVVMEYSTGKCSVDSGTISFIPEKLIRQYKFDRIDLGCWVTFKETTTINLNNGNVSAGKVKIKTGTDCDLDADAKNTHETFGSEIVEC